MKIGFIRVVDYYIMRKGEKPFKFKKINLTWILVYIISIYDWRVKASNYLEF